MTRSLVTGISLSLALLSVACAPPRHHDRYARSHDGRVDVNSASARELAALPGLDRDDAERIVANRPYPTADALVDRGVLGPRAYDRIEDYVYAGRSRRERWRDDRYDDREDRHERYYDDDR